MLQKDGSVNRALLLALIVLVAQASHAGEKSTVWDSAYDPATRKRFIPVELWTGGEWDGSRVLAMKPAHLKFGGHKEITGPFDYKIKGTDDIVKVYKRTNRSKIQYFTFSSRGDGLGRVYDSRYEHNCRDEVKMPLGEWSEGETRVLEYFCNGLKTPAHITITIEHLDFKFSGVPHSLKFHWVKGDGSSTATNMYYTYSPGLGMVEEYGNE
jgi:hypothetical protein